jgi:hypothetical protein
MKGASEITKNKEMKNENENGKRPTHLVRLHPKSPRDPDKAWTEERSKEKMRRKLKFNN